MRTHPFSLSGKGILVLMIALCIHVGHASGGSGGREIIRSNRVLLERLDSLIRNHDRVIEQKERTIAKLRSEYLQSTHPAKQLAAARALYAEYQVYMPDSAMAYAKRTREIVERHFPADRDMLADCLLDEAFIFATQGFGQNALDILDRISPGTLSVASQINYYQVAQYVFSAQSLFNSIPSGNMEQWQRKANALRDSLRRCSPESLKETVWAPVAIAVESGDGQGVARADVERLRKAVSDAGEATRDNAINAYWLARHYESVGDQQNMIHYMTLAATYDAEIENREISAITELATWLYDNGDLDRAYTYLIYSSDQAQAYRNRARMINVSSVLSTVREAYREAIEARDHRLRSYLWLLAGLSGVLIAGVLLIVAALRRDNRTRRELAEANRRLEAIVTDRDRAIDALKSANDALSVANGELTEAAKVNEGLVTLAYRLSSGFINAIDDYRKKLLRKFKLKDYTGVGVALNDQDLVREHYKDFYEAFDHAILSIFPDFPAEFNAANPDEQRVDERQIRKTRTLSTRMRIHALRRLGVDKSQEIATILNLSVRTVYNNR